MKNKKLIGLLAIIMGLLLIAPYFTGNMAKETVEKQAEEISKIPGYVFKVISYDKGWFTSHVIMNYGFDEHTLNILEKSAEKGNDVDQQTMKALKDGITFDVTVAHGPVTLQNGLNFALLTLSGSLKDIDHEIYRDIKERTKINSPLTIFASVSYGGETTLNVQSPAFDIDYIDNITAEKFTLNFGGIFAKTHINSHFDQFESNLEIPHAQFTMPTGNISLEGMNAISNGIKVNDYLWLGNGNFSLKNLNFVEQKNDISFSLNDFNTTYNLNKESDKNLAFQSNLNAENIKENDINLEKFHLDFSLSQLDIDAVTDYVKSINEAYQTAENMTQTAEQTSEKIVEIVKRVGDNLLKSSPKFIVHDLSFMMGNGIFKSDGKLFLNNENLENIPPLSDPSAIMALNKNINLSIFIAFDKTIAKSLAAIALKRQLTAGGVDMDKMPQEQFDQMIELQTSAALQNFTNLGYLIMNGEDYTTSFKMEKGQRSFNGKLLPAMLHAAETPVDK
ncbi:MAG: YdgA family protein [Emcibacter sp.]|nr:YdgA family protein [Emcibacter sp.]